MPDKRTFEELSFIWCMIKASSWAFLLPLLVQAPCETNAIDPDSGKLVRSKAFEEGLRSKWTLTVFDLYARWKL
jgi:hypothetical protein